jgi:hypothetical protein
VHRCDNEFRARTLKDPSCDPEQENSNCEWDYTRDKNGKFIDPECASPEAITDWLKGKTMLTKVMN